MKQDPERFEKHNAPNGWGMEVELAHRDEDLWVLAISKEPVCKLAIPFVKSLDRI